MKKERYEIKYQLNEIELIFIKSFLIRSSASKFFNDRIVNSIYFDTPLFDFCNENLQGLSKRKKVRLRWYDEYTIPTLEFKLRNDRVGTKKNYSLHNITKKDLYQMEINSLTKKIFHNIQFDSSIGYLIPLVYINYEREYYELENGIRITIDKKIKYRPLSFGSCLNSHKKICDNKIIVEIKFSRNQKSAAKDLIKSLEISPVRNSKYLNGLARLGYANYL